MDWKSTGDRQLEYLKDLATNSFTLLEEIRHMREELTLLNNNLFGVLYNDTISSSPSPPNVDQPAVGFTAENRKVPACHRSCQTGDGDTTEDRESTVA
jgi:hypothetical protein